MKQELRIRKNMRLENYDYSQPGYYFVTICTQVRYENILCEIAPSSRRPAAEDRPYMPDSSPVGGGLRAAPPSIGHSRPLSNRPAGSASVGGGLCAAPPFPQLPLIVLTNLGHFVKKSIEQIPIVNPGVVVDTYAIMPDHIHLILNLTGRHGGRPLPNIIGRFKSYTDHCYRASGSPLGPYFWQEGYHDHIIRNGDDLQATREYIENNPLKWVLDRTEEHGKEKSAK